MRVGAGVRGRPPSGLEQTGWRRRNRKGGREGAARPPAGQRGKGGKKGLGQNLGLGQNGRKVIFFSKTKPFPNLFSLFSILSQIQIKFEFNFKSSSPTLNQKPYALA